MAIRPSHCLLVFLCNMHDDYIIKQILQESKSLRRKAYSRRPSAKNVEGDMDYL